jgi:hypothetical protein
MEEHVNRERVLLLVRKYERAIFSPEEAARLAIVTERMNRLVTPISPEELEFYRQTLDYLGEVSEESERLERKLGLESDSPALPVSKE